MEKLTTEFFDINLGSVASTLTVWEAFKATCRGWLISLSSAEKKKHEAVRTQLNNQSKKLEELHMQNPADLNLKNALLATRADLQKMIHDETAFALFRLRRTYFENGEKSGKMLALRLKQMENKQAIPAVRKEKDELLCDATAINHSFRNFYSNLYASIYEAKAGCIF